MSADIEALQRWDERIACVAEDMGLDCFPQEFELCDHNEMLGYMAYSGMPSHYPHWSYGKAYEKLRTLYQYGVQGLPYEMVINSNPCLAYLMADNSLTLNVLTIAHVYGHNDFFKNNFTFSSTRPEFTIGTFKSHAERVRTYLEDPSIGIQRVESVLDAAHALSLQCRRNLAIRKLDRKTQEERALRSAQPAPDPHRTIHPKREYEEPDLRRVPLEPDEDVLLFIRDHNPFLTAWERDLLTIVHEESQYFIPQIETKIMNEGWASFWHYQIMNALDLPENMKLEFLVHHHRVLQPQPGGLNPYHLGFVLWKHIYETHEGGGDLRRRSPARDALFAARESERDRSFLRRFLTEHLIRELGLFEYAEKNRDLVVTEVADDEGWEKIRDSLLRTVGMSAVPVVKVLDADFEGNRALLLGHEFDGRELDLEHAEKTLGFAYRLWGRPVLLDTVIENTPCLFIFDDEGLSQRKKN